MSQAEPTPAAPTPTSPRARRAAIAALVVSAILLVAGIGWLGTDVTAFVTWAQQAGPAAVALFVVVVGVIGVFMIPASIPEIAAGFLWGPVWGFGLSWAITVLASCGCFLLGRTLLRGFVERRLMGHPRFAALDAAIGDSGIGLVILLRLSPLSPFHVITYALALTRIPLKQYAIGTAIGCLFPTFVYVYIGTSVNSVAELLDRPSEGWVYWGGLVVTLLVTIPITRYATRAIQAALNAPSR